MRRGFAPAPIGSAPLNFRHRVAPTSRSPLPGLCLPRIALRTFRPPIPRTPPRALPCPNPRNAHHPRRRVPAQGRPGRRAARPNRHLLRRHGRRPDPRRPRGVPRPDPPQPRAGAGPDVHPLHRRAGREEPAGVRAQQAAHGLRQEAGEAGGQVVHLRLCGGPRGIRPRAHRQLQRAEGQGGAVAHGGGQPGQGEQKRVGAAAHRHHLHRAGAGEGDGREPRALLVVRVQEGPGRVRPAQGAPGQRADLPQAGVGAGFGDGVRL